VPVVGFGTDRFPAFYLRESEAGVDARFDDEGDLAAFLRSELERSGRAVVVAQPVPEPAAVSAQDWAAWLQEAERRAAAAGAAGRGVTPGVLAALHAVSGGRTLEANVALAVSNAALAGRLCARMLRA
jgi:pseudouridine-5'-phosphate glycosidase